MVRTYKPGLKPRPGEKAGEACEAPGCSRTTSSRWLAGGRCCSSVVCEAHFNIGKGKARTVLANVTNVNAAIVAASARKWVASIDAELLRALAATGGGDVEQRLQLCTARQLAHAGHAVPLSERAR